MGRVELMVKMLGDLYRLTVEGRGRSKEARGLRKRVNGLWDRLGKVDKLSVYAVAAQYFNPSWTGVPGPKFVV